MAKAQFRLVMPAIKKRTVMPARAKNCDLRTREYLTEREVMAQIDMAVAVAALDDLQGGDKPALATIESRSPAEFQHSRQAFSAQAADCRRNK